MKTYWVGLKGKTVLEHSFSGSKERTLEKIRRIGHRNGPRVFTKAELRDGGVEIIPVAIYDISDGVLRQVSEHNQDKRQRGGVEAGRR